ncbi:retrovirus-related pol polyprotein from transposon TNT 1-94 [Tanacetum coccineum]
MVMQVQMHVMMQVKLEWRQYLENITFCYHFGMLIHHSLKIQGVILMLDSNLQEMMKKVTKEPRKEGGDPSKEGESKDQEKENNVNSTNNVNVAGIEVNVVGAKASIDLPDDPICLLWKILSIQMMIKMLVWTLVDLPNGKRPIGTKWVYKNKKDEREIVIRNKARLVAQGYTQEERINYDEVFTPVVRIEAIRLFLAYVSFKDFVVYQMEVKSVFLYGKIEEEVYVRQPPGFEDPDFPDRVYKVKKGSLWTVSSSQSLVYNLVNLFVRQWVSERKDRQDFVY